MGLEFQTATSPEEGGIPTGAVEAFIKEIGEKQLALHGFMLLRGKTILAERYVKPFSRTANHRMYSITKSFTSLAIGLLVQEGKLALTDKICDYFSEKLPKEVDERIAAMTIRDMLCMSSAHRMTTYKRYDGDWVESFFHLKPSHQPGTVFSYDTSATHTLTALVEKLTGKELLAYLKEKFLDKLGFSDGAYILKEPAGVSMGGSGLVCPIEDLAKVAYLCNHYGVLDGEELYPSQYLKEATSKQIGTPLQVIQDEREGYGYYFWRARKDGFCMYGMGGQLAVCFPQHDFVFLTIADMQGSGVALQPLYDAFYNHIYPYVVGETVEKTIVTEEKCGLSLPIPKGELSSTLGSQLFGKKILFDSNELGLKYAKVEYRETDKKGSLKYENAYGVHRIAFGMGEFVEHSFPEVEYPAVTAAVWEQENRLVLRSFLLGDNLANLWIEIGFCGERVSVHMKRAAENFLNHYDGFAGGIIQVFEEC
ncbi:MAG: serine hydrolase [Lachnospiraceae bacterium]|nr:serine hydrolase [Lachnospiraceae bacterium]